MKKAPLAATRLDRWLRPVLLPGAALALLGLALWMRSPDVEETSLQSDQSVTVRHDGAVLAFLPVTAPGRTALIFICGSAVAAEAYAPLLRPVAQAGYPVFVVNLPFGRAPLESHRPIVFDRLQQVIASHREVTGWVLAGHSLGAALAARFADAAPDQLSGLVLIATTYPQQEDLSRLRIPVTKITATNDGLVAEEKVRANLGKLPAHTRWIEIEGGNHSQFGRYENTYVDGEATISREEQEAVTRSAIIRLLVEADRRK